MALMIHSLTNWPLKRLNAEIFPHTQRTHSPRETNMTLA